ELDPVTQTRTARPSAQHYAQLIRESMGMAQPQKEAIGSETPMSEALVPEIAGENGNGVHLNGNGRSAELSSGMVAENESGFRK
ncbi:MAG TPA: hypothetical protein VKV30_05650, partial [Candidatus Angelobacter sp.]|nr:hypothetical protein [Candidatus Angelobacter sp.]